MSRVSIKANASNQYSHNFSPTTLLSLDFGEFGVTRCIEGQLGESYDSIVSNGILRCQPQVFPPYGKLFLNQASFFVPSHQLYEHYDAMRADMTVERGHKVMNPLISSVDIIRFFMNPDHSFSNYTLSTVYATHSDPTTSQAIADSKKSDFTFIRWSNGAAVYVYYKLTVPGRRYYKLLKSLGFDFVQFRYSNPQSSSAVDNDILASDFYPNIYPLLAYCKIFVDMFQNGHFYNSSLLTALLDSIRTGRSYSLGSVTFYSVSSNSSLLTPSGLGLILDSVLVPHKSNMYTEAYNDIVSPTGVIGVDESVNSLPSVSVTDGNGVSPLVSRNGFSGVINGTDGVNIDVSSQQLSDFGLRTLRWFADFVYRRNLVGSKAVDRLFANFGIEPDERQFHYVKKLGEISQRINFHPVVSNTDSYNSQTEEGKVLGAYAGFAAEGMSMSYNYKLREYGYIIQVAYLTIEPLIMHGFDPQVLRRLPLDFFTPGYDAETVRAIPACELTYDKNFVVSLSNHHTKDVYGFVDTYDDYRQMRDIVAGVFVHEGEDFCFGRDFSKVSELKPQTDFVHYYGKVDNVDLTNPFYTSQSEGDRFYLQLDFDIKLQSPVKSKDNALKVPAGNTTVAPGGNLMS